MQFNHKIIVVFMHKLVHDVVVLLFTHVCTLLLRNQSFYYHMNYNYLIINNDQFVMNKH